MNKNNLYFFVYSRLLWLFSKARTEEGRLAFAQSIGRYLWKNNIGLYRTIELDHFFNEYSKQHFSQYRIAKPNFDRNNIVHVVSTTYVTGGHSRFIENLITLDTTRKHHIIVLDQQNIPKRKTLDELVHRQGGIIKYLPDHFSTDEKCTSLINFVIENAGSVILHHHPDDMVPSLALPVLKDHFEIIFFNHADHCYAFGFEIASKVINIREEAHRMTVHLREVKNSFVLPLPIVKNNLNESLIPSLKKKYNIPDGYKIGLCITGPYKILPIGNFHFFRTIHKALNENHDLIVLIVGIDDKDTLDSDLGFLEHDRLRLLGIIEDPSEIQRIADVAIDPIPLGSYTALLETCFYGAIPMVSYDQIELFNLYNDPSFKGSFQLAKTETDYLAQLKNILENLNHEKKRSISMNLSKYHSSELWLEQMEIILSITNLNENVKLPETESESVFLRQNSDDLKYHFLQLIYLNTEHISKANLLRLLTTLFFKGFKQRELAGILKKKVTIG